MGGEGMGGEGRGGEGNGVARIFVWGGATRPMPPGSFSVISGSRPDSVGGGSSRNVP